jgi:hypothetical protein
MDIASGALRAYYLFDVADTIDIAALRTISGEGLAPADIPLRQHKSSAYLQFPVPPLVARLDDAKIGDDLWSVRVKLFDYGVISLRLSLPVSGSWESAIEKSIQFRNDTRLAAYATETMERLRAELGPALDDPHKPLVEDFLVVDIERFGRPVSGEQLLADHSHELVASILGERSELSRSEIDQTLRVRFSYYTDDLTIVQWDSAFIYDRRESSDAIQDILEFANSQLLELRTYDTLLDSELDGIYKMQPGGPARSLLGRREADQAQTLRYLIVDVLELIDRSSNALKVVGDAYYARIYRAAAVRLGLEDWQKQIDSKLASIGDMYRFFIDQARSRRDEFMEIIVIVLIALELVVGVFTLVQH